MTIELHSISSASNNTMMQQLINSIMNDDHAGARMAQDVIKATAVMKDNHSFTQDIANIASGLNGGKLRSDDLTISV